MRRILQLILIILIFSCTNKKEIIVQEIALYKDSVFKTTFKVDSIKRVLAVLITPDSDESTGSKRIPHPPNPDKLADIVASDNYQNLILITAELELKIDFYKSHADSLELELKKY